MINIANLYTLYKKHNTVCTDSRNIQHGCLFFALKGPSFNGNQYAKDALNSGAAYAVIDDRDFAENDKYLVVEDSLKALQQLATYHREQLAIPIIGIAGSNGKTTTKELLSAVLSTSYQAYATPGNYNNEIGVPLSLLQIDNKTEIAVLELGARHLGDVDELCAIAKPDLGIVTNTGKDHLETFGTLENTLKANAELYIYLQQNRGAAFVNANDEQLMKVTDGYQARVTYGSVEQSSIKGRIKGIFPYLHFSVLKDEGEHLINSQLIGKYNFDNLMAAVAIGMHFKIPLRLIQRAIESYAPTNNRSQLVTSGSNTIIMDAYNANPSSMEEALKSFDEIEADNKIVVLGDMLELGEYSYEEHLLMALRLKNMILKKVILIGEEFGKVADKLKCQHFISAEEAKTWYVEQEFENCTFLFKGSRGIALEKILD